MPDTYSTTRLKDAVRDSREKLRPFREFRNRAIRKFVGGHYGDDDVIKEQVPVNLILLATQVLFRQLAASNPRAYVTTRSASLRPQAKNLELALNYLSDQIDLGGTLQAAVMDAVFGLGVVRTAVNPSTESYIEGYLHDPGQPYCTHIDLDDLVFDMLAKRWDQITYIGNRERVSIKEIKESGIYDKAAVAKLKPISRTTLNEDGDSRADRESLGDVGDPDELYDFTEIWHLWLPREFKLVTIAADEGLDLLSGNVLRETDWEGPEAGPYRILTFTDVPGNLVPLAPVHEIYDLHEMMNTIYCKLAQQAERQKTIVAARLGGGEDDAQRVRKAGDGQVVPFDDPKNIQEIKFGGIDQTNLGFMLNVQNLASYFFGNLEVMGGLGQQAETLGQEQILQASASKRIVDYQRRVINFSKGVMRDLAYWLWTDPVTRLPLTKPVANTSISVPVDYGPEMRTGDFLAYNIEIHPYSLQNQTPQEQAAKLADVMLNQIVPLMPYLQQQGHAVDIAAYFKELSQLLNIPNLENMLTVSSEEPVMPGDGRSHERQPGPSTTTRRYIREGRSSMTPEGQRNETMRALVNAGAGEGSGI